MSMFFVSLIVVSCASIVFGLQCYQCGQYNDGVGSITPCINYTHMISKDCPTLEHLWCIKYVSEGTTIRDCVKSCTEKESWGRTYCCQEDGCNTSSSTRHHFLVLVISACAVFLHRQMRQTH